MDIANFGANFSMVCEHLTLFAFLVFAVPLISFVSVKFWIAARANKSQSRRNWFVPDDPQSDAARLRYSATHRSVAFATAVRNPRRAANRHSSIR
jgi:hypothetical protein